MATKAGAANERMLLDVHELALRAGPLELLRGLTLRVERGQFWAVVGRNGAGKTTLLATLAGITMPEAGRIDLLGRPLASWRPADAAGVRGFLPQHVEPLFGVSVLQAALLGRHPHQGRRFATMWESIEDVSIAIDALEQVDLQGLASRDMASLSGGERQRAALASLFAQDPLLYLLDEPLSHLDLHHQYAAMQLLRARAVEGERAVMASVHDLSMAARFATHALVFTGDGECVSGPAAAVLDEATLSTAFGHRVRRLVEGETVALVAG